MKFFHIPFLIILGKAIGCKKDAAKQGIVLVNTLHMLHRLYSNRSDMEQSSVSHILTSTSISSLVIVLLI